MKLGTFYSFYSESNYQLGLFVDENAEECMALIQVIKVNRKTREAVWPKELEFIEVAYREVLMEFKEPETEDGEKYKFDKVDVINCRQRYNMY